MTRTNRAVVIYGNDAELHIQMKRFDKGSGTFIDFDMTKTTDLTVELTCSKHATHIPLKYKINDEYHNILDCEIDWRLLHTNNSYGVIVQGYDEYDEHFRFEMLPSELFLVISNTSGLKVTDDYSETSVESITVTGAVGWGISVGDLSQYYTKNETEQYVQGELEDYYDKTETNALLDEKANSADLATVATSGNYNDLINKPIIPAGQIQSDWSQTNPSEVDYIKNKPNLATVATSGDYDDLTNKPNLSQYATQTDLAGKQDTLVSGTNIKTINNESILGSGNIDIQGGGGENHDNADEATANALFELNERLSEAEINIDIIPTEVQAKIDELEANVEQSLDELPPKFDEIDEEFKSTALVIEELHETAQPTLVSGTNIKTINNESILGSGNITIGGGVQSNWNETDTTSLAYIQNKPSIQNPGFIQYTNPTNNTKKGLVNSLSTYYDTNIGDCAIIEGSGYNSNTLISASGLYSHAEGTQTTASGLSSHAEGFKTTASGNYSHASGDRTTASGTASYANGIFTLAQNNYEHASGRHNNSTKTNNTFGDNGNTLFSVGNGNSASNKHNAIEIRQNGDLYIADTNNTTYSNYYEKPMIKLQDAMVTSTTNGLKIEVVSALPANPSNDTIYIIQ